MGEGELDLVFVPPWNSNIELYWDEPACVRFFNRLASFSRLILFDKRGSGLSDRIGGAGPIEQLMRDIGAVMDAAESESAALLGGLWGGPASLLFAASHPDRISHLVLYGSFATRVRGPDYPWAPAPEERSRGLDEFVEGWPEGRDLDAMAPSVAGQKQFREWWARMHRHSAGPAMIRAEVEVMSRVDVREILPTIDVPTLVLHRAGDRVIDPGNGRYLAEHIRGAVYRELDGDDHLPFVGDVRTLLGAIEEFLTGEQPARACDTALLTVLFTDIVGSTEKASKLGDREWNEVMRAHDAAVHRQLERYRGTPIKTLGDGFLATFDGPARAIRCAVAVRDAVRPLDIDIRAGVHTGECDLIGADVGGMAVNIAARVAAVGKAGEVLVSSIVKHLVPGSDIEFSEHGTHTLKGVPGEWQLFTVEA